MVSETSFDFNHYKYLNIGGGNFEHRADGWLNLDYPFEATARKRNWDLIDIKHNLMTRKPLPVPDAVFEGVYTEHCIEHLPIINAYMLFAEAQRILKPQGIFRISCPDADYFLRVLRGLPVSQKGMPNQWIPTETNTPQDIFIDALCSTAQSDEMPSGFLIALGNAYKWDLNEIMQKIKKYIPVNSLEEQAKKPGHHLSWWNHERISFYLAQADFRYITDPLPPNESQCKAFRADYIDQTCPECSLRVECKKA